MKKELNLLLQKIYYQFENILHKFKIWYIIKIKCKYFNDLNEEKIIFIILLSKLTVFYYLRNISFEEYS